MNVSSAKPPGRLAQQLEGATFVVLSTLVVLYIGVELAELIYQFGSALWTPNDGDGRLLIGTEQITTMLTMLFNILIAVELLDTFRSYMHEHAVKVQHILLIALTAIGRKLIALDITKTDGVSVLALAAVITSLCVGYYLLKRLERETPATPPADRMSAPAAEPEV